MHRNPVKRGLVEKPELWQWSSFRSCADGEAGLVGVNDWGLLDDCPQDHDVITKASDFVASFLL